MVLSTQQVRDEYGADCTEREVAGAQEAWDGLSAWMEHFGYQLRQADTGSRACRNITGGTKKSLHAVFLAVRILLWNLAKRIAGGAACDFNWQTNPYGQRLVTDMPRAMVDAICGIRTRSGAQVFRWGGYYAGNKDAMHYELVCTRADLATGIDPATLPSAANQEDDDMGLSEIQDKNLHDLVINVGDIHRGVAEIKIAMAKAMNIDEAELAKELAPLIKDSLIHLDSEQLQAIADAVNDEQAQRAKD